MQYKRVIQPRVLSAAWDLREILLLLAAQAEEPNSGSNHTATNEIKAYKIVNFDDAFKDFLVNNETKMKDSGATESVVLDDVKKSVMPYSAKDLYRRSSPITTGRTALTAQDDFYYTYFNRSVLDLVV